MAAKKTKPKASPKTKTAGAKPKADAPPAARKLEVINRGFDLMHEGKSIRSVVVF